ncbi:polyadenylate-binding protein-interacting protein 11-like isoform X2 [Nymphaea colorata]|uniref:polyadenylate-binding protein-interacting protein 11-like isoform X2 n=1 Tax=Nymphaea colorata TaxID=210225 RepID=UPI00129E3911|nr:polyadenylate-binding protein-interacting protein 11-like isoform X2 [Nymphaea colorata]
MAVVENAGVGLGMNSGSSPSGRNFGEDVQANGFETAEAESSSPSMTDHEEVKAKHFPNLGRPGGVPLHQAHGQLHNADLRLKVQQLQQRATPPASLPQAALGNQKPSVAKQDLVTDNGLQGSQHEALVDDHQHRSNGVELHENGTVEAGDGFKRDMRDLVDLLSKLNPMAEEFVPGSGVPFTNKFVLQSNNSGNGNHRKKNNYNQGKRRMNSRTSMAQREEIIRRTVYVSDIDHQVTEEQLAALFSHCGHVVDCRVCGDPNSVLRFAFIEFFDEDGAKAALGLAGTVLGYYPVRVLPSKTAIAPVNPSFLPRTEDEREMCTRTIYCTNIDKKVSQADVKLFFESLCGEVYRLRLLGDYHHSTRIAFVEFVLAESAINALNCSGAILGSLPIRVSPSKTPVRPRSPRPPMH